MKYIKIFIAAAVAFFTLQFSTASAAPALAEGTSVHAAKAAPVQQHRRHRRVHHHRIHRHKK
jgi:hypothetical protein